MSIAGVGASPGLQWLQNYLSPSGTGSGSQSSCGRQASTDMASISQQAMQLNASQGAQSPDASLTSGVTGTQGQQHHHHHHHHDKSGSGGQSFVDTLAQAIVTDLQQATGSGTPTGSGSSTAEPASSSLSGGSFLDKLASAIANDFLTQYQQTTGSTPPSTAQASPSSQVNTVA